MLKLRDAEGAPTLRFRLIAGLIALSMILIAAPALVAAISFFTS